MDFEFKNAFGEHVRVEVYSDASVDLELGHNGQRLGSLTMDENEAMQLGVALLPRVDRPSGWKNLPPAGIRVLVQYPDGQSRIELGDQVQPASGVLWCQYVPVLEGKTPLWRTITAEEGQWTAETIPKEGSWMGHDKDGPSAGYVTRFSDDWANNADAANMYNILYFLRMA